MTDTQLAYGRDLDPNRVHRIKGSFNVDKQHVRLTLNPSTINLEQTL